jgi:hypothetical protein
MSDFLDALDMEAGYNPGAAGLCHVLEWMLRHRKHSAREKFEMFHKLISLKGRIVGTPRELTGWR